MSGKVERMKEEEEENEERGRKKRRGEGRRRKGGKKAEVRREGRSGGDRGKEEEGRGLRKPLVKAKDGGAELSVEVVEPKGTPMVARRSGEKSLCTCFFRVYGVVYIPCL